MRERTERKARARRVLKNHYWLLLTVCLIGVVFGAEFSKGQIVSYETPVQNIVTVENSASLLRDRKSTRLNSSHSRASRMPSSA